MAENELQRLDLRATAFEQKLAESGPLITALRQQQENKLTAAQRALMGESGYHQLQQFGRVQPLVGLAREVASLVANTSEPLTASQHEQLLYIMANASGKYQAGGNANATSIDWSQAMPQAARILSPAQLVALRASSRIAETMKLVKQFYRQDTFEMRRQ